MNSFTVLLMPKGLLFYMYDHIFPYVSVQIIWIFKPRADPYIELDKKIELKLSR